MSQINPYYNITVLKLLPRVCPISLTEKEKQGKTTEEMFTDGVQVELTDAVGKKHKLVLRRAAFPILPYHANVKKLKPGTRASMVIECADAICIDLTDFEEQAP